MSFILPLLKAADPERHQRAVQGLQTGELTVSIKHKTDRTLRAVVRNGDGIEYGVHLGDFGSVCDCPDFAWRGSVPCKHAIAAAVFALQPPDVQIRHHTPITEKIHLMFADETIPCGHTLTPSSRWWKRWTLNALNWSDLVCQGCVAIYKSGYNRHLEMREAA